jgi:hypothetical protein
MFGFTFKSQKGTFTNEFGWLTGEYVFLSPIAYYKEIKERNLWISAARYAKFQAKFRYKMQYDREHGEHSYENHSGWLKRQKQERKNGFR